MFRRVSEGNGSPTGEAKLKGSQHTCHSIGVVGNHEWQQGDPSNYHIKKYYLERLCPAVDCNSLMKSISSLSNLVLAQLQIKLLKNLIIIN